MYKSIAIVFAVILVSLSAIAYNSEAATAALRTGHVGDTLRLRGLDTVGDTVKVTVTKTARIAAAGLYGVRITVRNVRNSYSKYPFDHTCRDIITKCVVVKDTKGKRHRAVRSAKDENGDKLLGQIDKVAISLGGKRSGWVYFALEPKQRPRAFQYTPDQGWGYDTGRWSLK